MRGGSTACLRPPELRSGSWWRKSAAARQEDARQGCRPRRRTDSTISIVVSDSRQQNADAALGRRAVYRGEFLDGPPFGAAIFTTPA